MDGYHRLQAVIEFGADMPFMVIIEKANDRDHLAEIYSTFNRPGTERSRTTPQLLGALNIADKIGVQKKVIEAVYGAVPIIDNGMRVVTVGDKSAIVRMGIMEVRLDIIENYSSEIIEYNNCLLNADTPIKNKLRNSSVVAVALQTLRYQQIGRAHV